MQSRMTGFRGTTCCLVTTINVTCACLVCLHTMEESEDLDVNAATLKQDDIETEAEENHDGDVTNETAIQVNFGTRETNRHQENQTQVDESKDRVEESIFDDERIAQSGNGKDSNLINN